VRNEDKQQQQQQQLLMSQAKKLINYFDTNEKTPSPRAQRRQRNASTLGDFVGLGPKSTAQSQNTEQGQRNKRYYHNTQPNYSTLLAGA
jgi:hypothetical protein